jgi:hypothetical protein
MKNKNKNIIIFKGILFKIGKFFNKEVISINGIDLLKEDLELYNQLKEEKINSKNIQKRIDFKKYKIDYSEIIKIFDIWYNRSILIKLNEKETMRGLLIQ